MASWLLRLLAAGILLQTLYFKFSAAPESVYIFTTLGVEPWGRIATGVAELAASLLLLLPATVPVGAALALGVMTGAIFSHLTRLGIALTLVGDRGELFALAVTVWACCAVLLVMHRFEAPVLGPLLLRSRP
jgi:uncharacterized membrane protein YphA (DoxX/SURF4 family)